MRSIFWIAALAAALVACDKGDSKSAPSGKEHLVTAWQKAGLTVSSLTQDKSGTIGTDCATGTVNKVDVAVCTFKTPGEAKAAEAKGWQWIGANTGTALTQGPLVLAVADRANADPSGRTINTISKTFTGDSGK